MKQILVVIFLLLNACGKSQVPTSSPTNEAPIFNTNISSTLAQKTYEEKYQEGIKNAITYFGSYTGVYVYTYDTTGLDKTIEEFCQKQDEYTSNSYSNCFSYESTNGHIKKDLATAQSHGFMTWLSSNNGLHSIFFALKDTLGDSASDDTASYLAHTAIHEYTHVFQTAKLDVAARPYNQIFNEGYAQLMGQYLGSLYSYTNFKNIMLSAFDQFDTEHQKDTSQFLTQIKNNFKDGSDDQRMPFQYAGASWCMAYLINKNNGDCTSNCMQGLNDLKSFYDNARSTNHESVFKEKFNYSSYDAFYEEVTQFLDNLNASTAETWITTLEARLPATTEVLYSQ